MTLSHKTVLHELSCLCRNRLLMHVSSFPPRLRAPRSHIHVYLLAEIELFSNPSDHLDRLQCIWQRSNILPPGPLPMSTLLAQTYTQEHEVHWFQVSITEDWFLSSYYLDTWWLRSQKKRSKCFLGKKRESDTTHHHYKLWNTVTYVYCPSNFMCLVWSLFPHTSGREEG